MPMPLSINGRWRTAVADTARKRVLIVDDASLVRMYYRQALEAAGFDVDEALNGLEALEKLLAGPVDLLVVDVNMPQMDGFTFVTALRSRASEIASIPVLIASTESAAEDLDAARQAGANFYLVKPLTQDQLALHARILTGCEA
jgi:two-component system, chemotaxis family, chemotaxis protein CheY